MTTETSDATLRLGTLLSAFAAFCAVVLTLLGDVSKSSLVVSVLIIGFLSSWIQSGYTMRATRASSRPLG
jgi:hypothetical protein